MTRQQRPTGGWLTARRRARRDRWRERYGPWAVVTGASSGIGYEIAHRVAEAGLHVVLVARRRAELTALAAELGARHGVETLVVSADLAEAAGCATLLEATRDTDAGLLVTAAGFGTSGAFLDGQLAAELEMLRLNCGATTALSYHFGRRFAERGRGGLILMSSIVAFQGAPYATHYAATKAYVQALAEALHVELAPRGVDVLASAPGPTHSGFAARAGMRMGVALAPRDVAQPTLDALGRRGTVLPGMLSKLLTYSLAPLPRPARVRIMGRVMRGLMAPR